MVSFPAWPGHRALFSLSFLGFFLSLVSGATVNRTIDDTFGDSSTGQLVTYVPNTGNVWQGKFCVGCAIMPDVSQAFDQTYSAATYNPTLGTMSITMQFTGTAIYVFFILANNAGDGITTSTLANFSVDGSSPHLYQHIPDLTTTAIDFNQLVYSQTNLKNTQHTLVISTTGDTDIYVNFDYAMYTHDDSVITTLLPATGSSSSSSSSSPTISASATSLSSTFPSKSSSTTSLAAGTTSSSTTISGSPSFTSVLGQDSASSNKNSSPIGAIVGGVIGGIAVVVALAFFLLWRMRRRRAKTEDTRTQNGENTSLYTQRRSPPHQGTVDPFITTNYSSIAPRNNVQGHTSDASRNTAVSPSLDTAYTYDGISDSSSDVRQMTHNSAAPSSFLAYYANDSRGALRSGTGSDHTPNFNNINDVRRSRQQELNQRLRTVQEEMAFLASDITGQESGPQPVRRRRTVTRSQAGTQGTGGEANGGATGEMEESEMSIAEMREQLQMLRNQVSYLQEQQRSDWARGLSDDPPPGYTPSSPPSHPA